MTHQRKISLLAGFATLFLFLMIGFTSRASAATTWQATYWNNKFLSGNAVLTRTENSINYNWGVGSPGFNVPTDNFSARWDRSDFFDAGRYRFTVAADDGVRLYVDGQLLIDQWHDSPATTYTTDVDLTHGNHFVRVEYYENGGSASIFADWQKLSGTPDNSWRADYWNNTSLAGNPVLTRYENTVDHIWGSGGPGNGVSNDFFSARYSRNFNVSAGTYRIDVTSDDGVRVWVNNNLLINQWSPNAATNFSADIVLPNGTANVRVEYYEGQGNAVIRANFYRVSGTNPTPQPPTPTPTPIKHPPLNLPLVQRGHLMNGVQCLGATQYVGILGVCDADSVWSIYKLGNHYLVQNHDNGLCMRRTQYSGGMQIRLGGCDGTDVNQLFFYEMNGDQLSLRLAPNPNLYLGIGGYGGNRAHLVNNFFAWRFVP